MRLGGRSLPAVIMLHTFGLLVLALFIWSAVRVGRNKKPAKGWSERYHRFLQSPRWKAVRARVLNRDRHTCQYCGQFATEVHHLRYDDWADPEVCLAVCRRCHERLHSKAR